jgi:peptidoglycan-associated lipoprotein
MLFVFFFTLIASTTYAQRKKNTAKADTAFKSGEYTKAIERYTKVYPRLKNKEQKAEVSFRLGECYRYMNETRKAKSYYKKAVRYKYADPIAVYYYAELLKIDEEYEDAIFEYDEYISRVPDDLKGPLGKKSCELAQKWLKNPTRHIIEPIKDINSKGMDCSPVVLGENELIFTSTRSGALGNKTNPNSGQSYSDLWYTQKDNKDDWSTPVQIQGQVNTPNDEGVASLSKDKKTLYYTFAEGGKKVSSRLKIFFAKRQGDIWNDPAEIIIFKDSTIDIGHPTISADELTMYFISDNPDGGMGKYDIWVATRKTKEGHWSNIKNLGQEVNTSANELFPYVHPDGTLYFSSNGHPAMGGMDIYKATKGDDDRWKVENMKVPINSSADDFGIVFEDGKKSGYFSSTRKIDNTRGSDDIFYFKLPPLEFALEGKVQDSEMGMPLPGAKIKLYGSDGTLVEATTDADGKFNFKLKGSTDYRAIAEREKYMRGKGKESTKGLKENKTLSMLIPLDPLGDTIEVENIFYDLDKADLKPESFVELDKLSEKLKDNPEVTVILSAHTDFRGDSKYNIKLSQARAQSVVDYLIEKGIPEENLTPRGHGEKNPKEVSAKIAKKYDFLNGGDILNEKFITALESEDEQEICHQINRRTEFIAIQTDDKEKAFYFGDPKKPEENENPEDDNKNKEDNK